MPESFCAILRKHALCFVIDTGGWVENSVDSIESRRLVDLVVKSSCRSRFVRYLENTRYVLLSILGGGLKIPSIRSNRDDSSTLLSSRHAELVLCDT